MGNAQEGRFWRTDDAPTLSPLSWNRNVRREEQRDNGGAKTVGQTGLGFFEVRLHRGCDVVPEEHSRQNKGKGRTFPYRSKREPENPEMEFGGQPAECDMYRRTYKRGNARTWPDREQGQSCLQR